MKNVKSVELTEEVFNKIDAIIEAAVEEAPEEPTTNCPNCGSNDIYIIDTLSSGELLECGICGISFQ